MADAIQDGKHVVPVQVLPGAGETEGLLDALLTSCLIGLLVISRVAHDFVFAVVDDDANQRLIAPSREAV